MRVKFWLWICESDFRSWIMKGVIIIWAIIIGIFATVTCIFLIYDSYYLKAAFCSLFVLGVFFLWFVGPVRKIRDENL